MSDMVLNLFLVIFAMLVGVAINYFTVKVSKKDYKEELRHAQDQIEASPEKIKPIWDLARITLESYFNKNLAQVSAIFWLCLIVMLIGFGIIIWGISSAINSPNGNIMAIITSASGIITEMIGASFLFVYKSTMQQASNYSKTLERINSVGMAMQILDTMPDNAVEENLKEKTKSEVVKMLMCNVYEIEEESTDVD